MKTSPSLVVDVQFTSAEVEVPIEPREFQLIAAFLPEVLKEFSRIQAEQQKD